MTYMPLAIIFVLSGVAEFFFCLMSFPRTFFNGQKAKNMHGRYLLSVRYPRPKAPTSTRDVDRVANFSAKNEKRENRTRNLSREKTDKKTKNFQSHF